MGVLSNADYNRVFQRTRAFNSDRLGKNTANLIVASERNFFMATLLTELPSFNKHWLRGQICPPLHFVWRHHIQWRGGQSGMQFLFAAVVNKVSLLDMMWVYNPETLRSHKPRWTLKDRQQAACALNAWPLRKRTERFAPSGTNQSRLQEQT